MRDALRRHVIDMKKQRRVSAGDRVAAVQYVKLPLSPAQREAFRSGRESVFIELDHPNYRAVAQLDEAVRETLASDLG